MSAPILQYNMKPSGLLSIFILLRFRQRRFQNSIRKFFIFVPLTMQNAFVFKDRYFEVAGKVRFVRIQSIRVVNLLIVDVYLNIGQNWVQIVVYMSREKSWSFFVLLRRHRFLIRFCLLFVLLFYFSGIVSFVTTTLAEFQFQSQVKLSQINVTVPTPLKFKLFAVFNESGSRTSFLFVGRPDIVNYWYLPSKVSRNCQKWLVPRIARHG